jgi:phosphate-selective porin OprO/OprP
MKLVSYTHHLQPCAVQNLVNIQVIIKNQSKYSILIVIWLICLLALLAMGEVMADSPQENSLRFLYLTPPEGAEKGLRGPVRGWHYYWEDGYFSIDNRKEDIKFRINGQIIVDAGNIDANDELQSAFPDLDGSNILFRKLNISTYGNFYDAVDFRVGIDFANAQDIQDIWIRYLNHPLFEKIMVGHMKEPFSLEYLTSISRVTFMERSLPDEAFGTGRNIGIRYDSSDPDRPVNLGVGLFLNTGSYSNLGGATDQIDEANGFDATARVFGRPVSNESGDKLLHLGLGYSYGIRIDDNLDKAMQYRTRPESHLTNYRLVDTGPIPGKRRDKANAEIAMVFGPLSLQGQFYYLTLDADTADDLGFWGYYTFLSYFITGEHRKYNPSLGIFTGVDPQPTFHPMKGEWGAWEIALRHSYVDLNDAGIKGGRESNFTTGLNWIHNRNTRLMFNYVNAQVSDRESPAVDDGNAHIFQVRFQFIW